MKFDCNSFLIFGVAFFGWCFIFFVSYLPRFGFWYNNDTFNYLLQARHGVFGFLPVMVRHYDFSPVLIGIFILLFFFTCCWLFFKLFFKSLIYVVLGVSLCMVLLYPILHLGIVDTPPFLVGCLLLFVVFVRKRWFLAWLPLLFGCVIWQKHLDFLWKFPSYMSKYLLLKDLGISELAFLSSFNFVLAAFFVIIAFYFFVRKKSLFWAFIWFLYTILFLFSFIMIRFYLFLIPFQVLYLVLIFKDLLVKSRLKWLFIVLLFSFFFILKINSFVLPPPEYDNVIIEGLQQIKGSFNNTGNIISSWDKGNLIWFFNGVEPVMHHSPDPYKLPFFVDALFTCDINESRRLLRCLPGNCGTYDQDVILVLFPNDILKLKSWSELTNYKIKECSLFWTYYNKTTISITEFI